MSFSVIRRPAKGVAETWDGTNSGKLRDLLPGNFVGVAGDTAVFSDDRGKIHCAARGYTVIAYQDGTYFMIVSPDAFKISHDIM